eukprot:s55_g15.t1
MQNCSLSAQTKQFAVTPTLSQTALIHPGTSTLAAGDMGCSTSILGDGATSGQVIPRTTYAHQENWDWDWNEGYQPRARGKGQGQGHGKPSRSASARAREAKGQGKHPTMEQESPFAKTAPWPASEGAPSSSPFQQSLIAPASAQMDADDAELLIAVKEMYPDISKAPPRIQTAVAKAEKTTAKQLTTGLNKSSKSVGHASKELKSLREARARHRERWLQHLKDAVNTWEHQLKLYTEQQTNYSKLIKKAQQDLSVARQTLEMLNKKAADSAGDDEVSRDAADQDAQANADTEAQLLVDQVQAVLQSCARAAIKDEIMEVSDGEDSAIAPAKRPRSMEPFGGGNVPGGPGGSSTPAP